jgi:ribosomal protein L37AE/L43A
MNKKENSIYHSKVMKYYIGECPSCGHKTVLRGAIEWVFRQCSKCVTTSRVAEWNFAHFTKFSQMVKK